MCSDFAKSVVPVPVEHELKQSYINYAMSVIVMRALPDVRDGLKPVHRRVLYAMYELRNDWNKPHKKSARVVGDVIGKYHPHGDTAVYDAIVRMAQDFSMRYPLIDGQGNFGSIDGDSAAAMRYTEIRMAKISHELLASLDKETVHFVPNYDNTEFAPEVLPTKVPNLLVNGSSGIAVGMATNIPPHHLGEVLDACLYMLDHADASVVDLMQFVKGPDFPTAAFINGRAGIRQAYETGRGKIWIRSRAHIEEDKSGKETIIVSELPYQVNKARLLEKISLLVKEKKIDGITGLRDESDKDGIRVVIEVRRGVHAEVLLNQLYKQTQLQVVFGINMVALDKGHPKCMNLQQIIQAFIQHRQEVVTRRTLFDLRKARERAHILEGLALSLSHIDEIVALIKAAKTPAEAKQQLLAKPWDAQYITKMIAADKTMTRPEQLEATFGIHGQLYHLSPVQAQAILDLRLHRLTGLERDKIESEYQALIEQIQYYLSILQSHDVLLRVIKEELTTIKAQFADERRTEITDLIDLSQEDLIPKEEVVVTLSREGYVKVQLLEGYQAQRRGGMGKSSSQMKDDDYMKILEVANTHDMLLIFTTHGKLYWKKVYELPLVSRQAKGKPIVNFLNLDEGETISAILPIQEFCDVASVMMATKGGKIKKVALSLFSRPRANGIIAIDLIDGDTLLNVGIVQPNQEVMIFSNAGKVIRFHESDVRQMGRGAQGVRAIRLADGQHVVSMIVVKGDAPILTATKRGYGKRTPLEQYRQTKRGGQGVMSIQINERNKEVIGALQLDHDDEVMIISQQGSIVRMHSHEVSLIGRNTQGVRLVQFKGEEHIIDLKPIYVKEELSSEDDIQENSLTEGETVSVETQDDMSDNAQDAS